jgi:hypothetical protein
MRMPVAAASPPPRTHDGGNDDAASSLESTLGESKSIRNAPGSIRVSGGVQRLAEQVFPARRSGS